MSAIKKFKLLISSLLLLFLCNNSLGFTNACAKKYLSYINEVKRRLYNEEMEAAWTYNTNITKENEENHIKVQNKVAKEWKEHWEWLINLPWENITDPDLHRQYKIFSILGEQALEEQDYNNYINIEKNMTTIYSTTKICLYENRINCTLPLEPDLTTIFRKSRKEDELKYYWLEWRKNVGFNLKETYTNNVKLLNKAALKNNFENATEMWLNDYRINVDSVENTNTKIWKKFDETLHVLQPFYRQLHAHIRHKLRQVYGEEVISKDGPIPAHLLGNMWGQSWNNLYDISMPFPEVELINITKKLNTNLITVLEMFRMAEDFFKSIGFPRMTQEFWDKSVIEFPTTTQDLTQTKTQIKTQETQKTEMKAQEMQMKTQETEIKAQEMQRKTQETEIKAQEMQMKTQGMQRKTQETQKTQIQTQETQIKAQEIQIKTQEMQMKTQELQIKAQENGKGVEMVCHPSAWDFANKSKQDFRIKMCATVSYSDLITIHHEMGHIHYYMAYANQPFVYRDSPNPGFHEAIGDTIALSVKTIKHLEKIKLIDKNDFLTNAKEKETRQKLILNNLYLNALSVIPFLPFAYSLDAWRFDVFNGLIQEKDYNCAWWKIVNTYQGVEPPEDRSEQNFDPISKFHVAINYPYISYFAANIYLYQFHRSLCLLADGEYDPNNVGEKPLHECDIYGNKKVGSALLSVLKMGKSKPWPVLLECLTGVKDMDPSAILEYFDPLIEWIDKENKKNNVYIGWKSPKKICREENNV